MEKNKGDNMIVIKTEDMNQKINKLQKAIDDLELDLLNFYKELKESSDFWRDQKSMIFYNNVENRKINEEQFILELKEYQNILKNTESKYSMYGNIIKYDSDKRNIEAIDEFFYYNKEELERLDREDRIEDAKKEAREEGITQGITQRNIEIAKSLLKSGMNIQDVSRHTGLTKDEIEKLK